MKDIEIGSISLPYSLPKGTACLVWGHETPSEHQRENIWNRLYLDGRKPELWCWSEERQNWIPLEEHRNCNKTMTDQEIITVVTARLAGKRIEKRREFKGEQPWVLDDLECWNFLEYDYRVASEPRRAWFKHGFQGNTMTTQWMECDKDEPGAVQFVEVKP